MNDYNIGKDDIVQLKDHPGSNLLDWDEGRVVKLNMDEDEALIETQIAGEYRRFWEFVSNLKK